MKHWIVFIALAALAVRGADLPRYHFAPGQELVYTTSSDFSFKGGAFKNDDVTTFWVTSENTDGSWHLVYANKHRFARAGNFAETNEATQIGSLDLFSDGRTAGTPKISEGALPSIFILLPADDTQTKGGWEFAENEASSTAFHVKSAPSQPQGEWVIQATGKGIFHDIYLMTSDKTIYFDGSAGVIKKIEGRTGQGYGFEGQGTVVTKLTADEIRDKDWIAQLAADAAALESARAADEKAFDSVKNGTPPAQAEAAARQAWRSASAQVKNPQIQSEIQSDLNKLDREFGYAEQERQSGDLILNKPAADWQTTDLEGHKHALADYRGKVVALDFWYRGCGWCMRAMPQIKQLADEFRGQPVAILGMNTDRDDKDAQFVMDKLGLNYPTLHGQGIPEKYGVQGFPTFIVIDQKGEVRARHIGYSPTLYQEMSKTIEGLLANSR